MSSRKHHQHWNKQLRLTAYVPFVYRQRAQTHVTLASDVAAFPCSRRTVNNRRSIVRVVGGKRGLENC